MTIKQIHDSSQAVQDGEYTSHGVELSMVSFVAVVRNLNEASTRLVVTAEDGTGSINITLWPKQGDEDAYKFITEGNYYHFSGTLTDFSGKRTIQHCVARPVEDSMEIIYHNLSVVDTYISANGMNSKTSAQAQQGNYLFVQEPFHGNESTNSGSLTDRVFKCIESHTPSMPEGVQVSFVATHLGVAIDQVVNECARLTEEAKIYLGYDENGYLAV